MKKVLLLSLCLFGVMELSAGTNKFFSYASYPVEVEVKQIAETKLGCKAGKKTITPGGNLVKVKVPCIIKKVRYRKKGTKKWYEVKSKDGRKITFDQKYRVGELVVSVGKDIVGRQNPEYGTAAWHKWHEQEKALKRGNRFL